MSSFLPTRINQNNIHLNKYIRKYGCLFLSMAYSSTMQLDEGTINAMWDECIKRGYITGDVNKNGSFDDPEDLCILKPHYDDIMKLVGSPYTFNNITYDRPNDTGYHIACYVYKGGTHFVVVDHDERIIYDPTPNSNSVRYGEIAHFKNFIIKVA